MFEDKGKEFEKMIVDLAGTNGDFHSAYGNSYMDVAGIMGIAKHLVERKPTDDPSKPLRLGKGVDCPVCGHMARLEYKYLGEGGADESKHACDKCGFTDTSLTGGSEYELTLEEFQWKFNWMDEEEEVERKVKEQRQVVALYRKFWSGDSISAEEEAVLDELASKNRVANVM